MGGGDDEDFKVGADDEEDKSQTIIKLKHMVLSMLMASHKNFIADAAFIPPTINVDKRNPSNGKFSHLLTVSEDGIVNIWDTRSIDKETLKVQVDFAWRPFNRLDLFKQDGSGELGLSRVLL